MIVGKTLKVTRGNDSQLKASFKLNVSRESVSAYETERVDIPADVSKQIVQQYDNPWYSFAIDHEYSAGAGVRQLDGSNVDLHRSSVKAKTEEELEEALLAIRSISVANKPDVSNSITQKNIEQALIQVIDAIYAAKHLVAILSKEYGIGWLNVWQKQHQKLVERGYVRG